MGKCDSFVDATITASISSLSSIAFQSVNAFGTFQRFAAARVRSGSRPHTAVNRPIGWLASAGKYIASDHQLVPTMPTRTSGCAVNFWL